MLPKVMAGNQDALTAGLRAYEPGVRLWDRNRVWDVADPIPDGRSTQAAVAPTGANRQREVKMARSLPGAALEQFGKRGARSAFKMSVSPAQRQFSRISSTVPYAASYPIHWQGWRRTVHDRERGS